jgi:hypothetical protein
LSSRYLWYSGRSRHRSATCLSFPMSSISASIRTFSTSTIERNNDLLTAGGIVQFWPDIAKNNRTHFNAIEISLETMHDVDFLDLISS